MSAVPHRKITRWKLRESYRIETVLSFNISFIEIKVSLILDISETLYAVKPRANSITKHSKIGGRGKIVSAVPHRKIT